MRTAMTKTKVALITGVTGQDGAYLAVSGGVNPPLFGGEDAGSDWHQARTRTTTETSRSLPTS